MIRREFLAGLPSEVVSPLVAQAEFLDFKGSLDARKRDEDSK